MPVNYQFLKADGTPESLAVIDQKLADHFGEWCDPKNYHWSFHSITWDGFSILRKSNAEKVTPEDFDKFTSMEVGAEGREIARRLLAEEYSFKAWYGR